MTTDRSQGPLVRGLFEGYGRGDADAVREAVSPDLVAYVTTADGGAGRVEGRDAYLDRLPDLRAAGGSVTVTQVPEVDEALVMAMVEIRAERGGDRLHNTAAFLARVDSGLITHLWMVEAQPAHSDEFWSS